MTRQATTFGSRLREIRRALNLTQEEFAKIFDTSKQVISRYEASKQSPKITVVRKFAACLGVSVSFLSGEYVDAVTPTAAHYQRLIRDAFKLDCSAEIL